MQPARRREPFRPLEASGGCPIDRRFGLDAVDLVAYPDPHAGVIERLHASVDLAVVELLQDALQRRRGQQSRHGSTYSRCQSTAHALIAERPLVEGCQLVGKLIVQRAKHQVGVL
jgi:hypothetical protein